MTDIDFLKELDKRFEAIQEADIKGESLCSFVIELYELCEEYIENCNNYKNILDGAD